MPTTHCPCEKNRSRLFGRATRCLLCARHCLGLHQRVRGGRRPERIFKACVYLVTCLLYLQTIRYNMHCIFIEKQRWEKPKEENQTLMFTIVFYNLFFFFFSPYLAISCGCFLQLLNILLQWWFSNFQAQDSFTLLNY